MLQCLGIKSLELEDVGLNPNPAIYQLCDLEQVAQPLCAHFLISQLKIIRPTYYYKEVNELSL